MFQQALWIGGTDQQDEGQKVDLLKLSTPEQKYINRPE
jgi:hypothetical protein